MDDHGGRTDREGADDLLRRALLDPEAAVAVALRVGGLALADALTVIFHGRRDLGTIQTYVAHGGRGARRAPSRAGELLRVPCDLDLGDAASRDEAEAAYAEQARTLRDALVAADTVLAVWREPLEDLAEGEVGVDRSVGARRPAARPTGSCRSRSSRPSAASPSRPSAARARSPRAARRWASPAPSRTSPTSTRCPTTPSAAWRTSPSARPSTRARIAERLDHQEASVRRFLELNGGDGFAGDRPE